MSRKDHRVVAGAGGWRSIFSRGRTHSLKGAGYKPPPGTFQQYHSAQGMIDVFSITIQFEDLVTSKICCHYRRQRKVMFSQVSVILSSEGGGIQVLSRG